MAYILTDKPKRTAGNAWLERVNPLHGLTIAQARNIFDVARAHGSPLLQKIYDEIELVDPVLGVCVDRRQAALAELGWKISPRPSADQVLADEQKDALDAFVRGIGNFSETVEHLDLAFFRGFAVVQPIWEGEKVQRVALLESWNFLFDDDGALLWNPDCTLDPRGCFEIPPAARIVTVRRRRPIDYPALAIHIRKYLGERDWGRFIERYGIPPVDVVMAPNATNEQKSDYVEAAEAARDGRSTVWPSGTPQPSRAEGSRGQDPFTAFIEHQEKLIVLRATGGTLTSLAQADTGTLAGGAQMDVWDQIVKRDSSVISDALNRHLFWKFLDLAFPGRAPAVEFSIGREQEPTATEAADLAVKLRNAGYTVDQAELEEATGFTLEKTPETPQPGGFGGLSLNKQPATPLQAPKKLPIENAPEKPPRAPSDADGAPDAVLAAFAKDTGAAAEAVAELLENPTPDRAAALLKRLPELLPEDPALAAVIAEEMAKAYGEAFTASQKSQPSQESQQVTNKKNGECRAKDPAHCPTHGTPREPETKPQHDRYGSTDEATLASDSQKNFKRGANALEAMERMQGGYIDKAMFREETGWIRFDWGTKGDPDSKPVTFAHGHGISHILAKHGMEAKKLPDVIARGEAKKDPKDPKAIILVTDTAYAVVAPLMQSQRRIITMYEPQPNSTKLAAIKNYPPAPKLQGKKGG